MKPSEQQKDLITKISNEIAGWVELIVNKLGYQFRDFYICSNKYLQHLTISK